MYDHLVGEVVERQPARVVLRSGGIGFELKVPVSTSVALDVGATAELFTILHVVDGTPTLLGFADRRERDLARRLMTVSGVGPSVSLAVLSTYSPGQIARAILDGEAAAFKRVKGVGARIAERLCLELRDAMARWRLAGDLAPGDGDPVVMPQSSEDAVTALITLGYTAKDARARIEKVREPGADTEQLVRAVLRG